MLVRAVKTGKAPLRLLPPLVLHARDGAKHTAAAEARKEREAHIESFCVAVSRKIEALPHMMMHTMMIPHPHLPDCCTLALICFCVSNVSHFLHRISWED